MSGRRGRDRMGRFVSRDASEMARKLREMMEEAPDEASKREIQRLAEKMEQMQRNAETLAITGVADAFIFDLSHEIFKKV